MTKISQAVAELILVRKSYLRGKAETTDIKVLDWWDKYYDMRFNQIAENYGMNPVTLLLDYNECVGVE